MAQSGILIAAAEGARLPCFPAVFTDVGDEQSIERSLSTFSAHVANLSEIIAAGTLGALVLLDEPGVGTDPEEGAALAIGTVELLEKRGARVALTTHYAPVKRFALGRPELPSGGGRLRGRDADAALSPFVPHGRAQPRSSHRRTSRPAERASRRGARRRVGGVARLRAPRSSGSRKRDNASSTSSPKRRSAASRAKNAKPNRAASSRSCANAASAPGATSCVRRAPFCVARRRKAAPC